MGQAANPPGRCLSERQVPFLSGGCSGAGQPGPQQERRRDVPATAAPPAPPPSAPARGEEVTDAPRAKSESVRSTCCWCSSARGGPGHPPRLVCVLCPVITWLLTVSCEGPDPSSQQSFQGCGVSLQSVLPLNSVFLRTKVLNFDEVYFPDSPSSMDCILCHDQELFA